jgi:hypothetical protein
MQKMNDKQTRIQTNKDAKQTNRPVLFRKGAAEECGVSGVSSKGHTHPLNTCEKLKTTNERVERTTRQLQSMKGELPYIEEYR